MRKILSLLLALVLCVSLFGCAANQEPEHVYAPTEETTPATEATEETTPATEPELPAEDIVILYTNDVHTYIDGVLNYSVIAALKEALRLSIPMCCSLMPATTSRVLLLAPWTRARPLSS